MSFAQNQASQVRPQAQARRPCYFPLAHLACHGPSLPLLTDTEESCTWAGRLSLSSPEGEPVSLSPAGAEQPCIPALRGLGCGPASGRIPGLEGSAHRRPPGAAAAARPASCKARPRSAARSWPPSRCAGAAGTAGGSAAPGGRVRVLVRVCPAGASTCPPQPKPGPHLLKHEARAAALAGRLVPPLSQPAHEERVGASGQRTFPTQADRRRHEPPPTPSPLGLSFLEARRTPTSTGGGIRTPGQGRDLCSHVALPAPLRP